MAIPPHNWQSAALTPFDGRQGGGATLYAIAVLALCSMFIAAQLNLLQSQSEADAMSSQSLDARRASSVAIGLVHDMMSRGYMTRLCVGTRGRIVTSASAPAAVRVRLTKVFDERKQQLTLTACDPARLPDDALLEMKDGKQPKACAHVVSTVALAAGACDKAGRPVSNSIHTDVVTDVLHIAPTATVRTSKLAAATSFPTMDYRLKALMTVPTPTPPAPPVARTRGCIYTCHVNPETKKRERVLRPDGGYE